MCELCLPGFSLFHVAGREGAATGATLGDSFIAPHANAGAGTPASISPVSQSTLSVSSTGNQDIDGLLSGTKWGSSTITYSFPVSPTSYEYSGERDSNFHALTAAQQAAAEKAFALFSSYTNLTFTKLTETSTTHADIRLAQTDATQTAWAYYPSTAPQGGDAWFGYSNGIIADPRAGTYDFTTILHELGHSLGLKHGHETDVFGALPSAHNSMEYSVMTYASYVGASTSAGYTNEDTSFAQTPMMDDIAALQRMYGANFNSNATDTVYTWSPTTGAQSINGVSQGTPAGNRIFMTVWDGGGNDTYDFSNYATNLTVNLNPGSWSTASSTQLARLHWDGSKVAAGNVANALLYNGDTRSLIENAKGGSGADRLTGNSAANTLEGGAGNDILDGGSGNDMLIGGAGADSLYGGDGNDIYSVDSVFDTVIEGVGAGSDRIDTTLTSLTLGANVENLAYAGISTASFSGTGNTLNNAIWGWAGNDTLSGGAGSDYLDSSSGNDVLNGGTDNDLMLGRGGNDTYFVDHALDVVVEQAGEGTDRVEALLAQVTLAENVENLAYSGTSSSAFVGTGNSLDNAIWGWNGDDRLFGGAGSDYLDGSGGSDYLDGGSDCDIMLGRSGNDTYIVDHVSDLVIEYSGQGTDRVDTSLLRYELVAAVENMSFAGVSTADFTGVGNSEANAIWGWNGNDRLVGDLGDDYLYGAGGNDELFGGAGSDMLVGGAGLDTAVFAGIATDYTVSTLADGSRHVVHNATMVCDTLVDIEVIRYTTETILY